MHPTIILSGSGRANRTSTDHRVLRFFWAALIGSLGLTPAAGSDAPAPSPTTARAFWSQSPWSKPDFFPIGVWLQDPARAAEYRKAGFNTYVGLWRGPTEPQLTALKAAGLRVVCEQNTVGLAHRDDPTILAWMHGDEPDNAQSLGDGQGYGPPILPEVIVRDYARLRAADPARPVLLNLGQGVAWDGYYGRGVRTRHPEDYLAYLAGCDIGSFDIYPAVHEHPEVAGKLEFVARGVERLRAWTRTDQRVWNCLECTRISNPDRQPTPHEVRAEAWMSLIHGSQGLIYFVHQFKPVFREAALLDNPEMLEAVTRLNHQITALAPVLNQPTLKYAVRTEPTDPAVRVASMVKRLGGHLYVFAVGMQNNPTTVNFKVEGIQGDQPVEVLDENRTLPSRDGRFSDPFGAWDVHLYRLPSATPSAPAGAR